MRGVTLFVGLALSVGLLVTSTAAAVVEIDEATRSLENDVLTRTDTLDLLMPGPFQHSPIFAFDAVLPGDGTQLTPRTALLEGSTSLVATPTVDDPSITGPSISASDDPVNIEGPARAQGTIAPAESSSTGLDLPDYVTGSSDATSDETDSEASTQSRAHSAADTGSAAREAWDNLDDGEKAAITAGTLGLLLFGPLTLYSRIRRDDALENDTRRSIYEIVETNPGVCIQEVADDAGVSYSTASYHLKRLVRMDYVTRREDGNKVLYYKNGGTFTQDERDLIPVLQNEEAMRVFRHIVENPWCYRAQVAEALEVSHTTINWHLDRLQDADLVEEHREGRSCHLNVNEEALDRVVSTMDKLEQTASAEQIAAAPPAAAPA